MNEDFYEEEKGIEIGFNINKYTLKCLKVILIGIAIVWLLNILNIFIVDRTLMNRAVLATSIVLIATLLLGRVIDLHKKWVKYFLITVTIIVITILGASLTYHTLLLSMLPLMLATQYADRKVVAYTYVLSVISIFVSAIGGYYWGLCDANMLFLTNKPTAYYVDLVRQSATFERVNTNVLYTVSLYFAVPRCILLFLTIPVIESISKNIMKYEQYAFSMKQLSERDDMTGLFNRNKFLNMMEQKYSQMDRVCVIFFDVNNLKWVNDNLGHEKGDELLICAGRTILALADQTKKAYRIGGDEFVLVIEHPQEGEPDALIKRWEELEAFKEQSMDMELSVAYGYACGAGKDIDKIVKEADEKMYRKKKEQKSKKNK